MLLLIGFYPVMSLTLNCFLPLVLQPTTLAQLSAPCRQCAGTAARLQEAQVSHTEQEAELAQLQILLQVRVGCRDGLCIYVCVGMCVCACARACVWCVYKGI